MSVVTAARAQALGIPETVECRCCGRDAQTEYAYVLDFGVCGKCVEALWDAYNIEHGGEPAISEEGWAYSSGVSTDLRWQIFARDNFTCKHCGKTGVELTIDHIKARSRGGTNEEDNLQALCRPCNSRKGARDV